MAIHKFGVGSLWRLVVLAVTVAACDDTFEPIRPSDLAFSVFGYLDASADTQWIRVMPIRALKVTSPEPLDATVAVEEVGTGRIMQLEDSVFDFAPPFDWHLGAGGDYLHNFWTVEDIAPGATYRFVATRAGKEPAEAVVDIPHDYEVEVAIKQRRSGDDTDSLRITGLKHLAFVRIVKTFDDRCQTLGGLPEHGVLRQPIEMDSVANDTWVAAVTKSGLAPRATGCPPPDVVKWELWIMGSGAAWPTGGYDPSALGEASLTSNISHAVGFLGGVLTKLIPYGDCAFRSQGAPVPDFCRLRYDGETATLIGSVTAADGGALNRLAEVRLSELGQDPARIRTAHSGLPGEFVLGALQPGIPHILEAYPPQLVVDDSLYVNIYRPYTDTLTFLPGQRMEYEIRFERLAARSDQPPGSR
jgi:hypothetical protein